MQEKQFELRLCLESLPEEYHSLPFQEYFAKTIPIAALNNEAEAMLWHQRLIHCVLKCPTCLKVNLTKDFGKTSLRDSVERPFQELLIVFAFFGKIKRNKKGVVIQARREDVEGMNNETAWILISDAQIRILHGDTRLSKSSPQHWSWKRQECH